MGLGVFLTKKKKPERLISGFALDLGGRRCKIYKLLRATSNENVLLPAKPFFVIPWTITR